MNGLIENLLIVSIQASVLIVAVLIFRMMLNKTNKVFSYLMWVIILLRLCIPVVVETPYGIFNDGQTVYSEKGTDSYEQHNDIEQGANKEDYNASVLPNNFNQSAEQNVNDVSTQNLTQLSTENTISSMDSSKNSSIDKVAIEVSETSNEISLTSEQVIMIIWITGMVGVMAPAIVQCIRLKKRTRFAINTRENIWEADGLNTAFVMGLFRPRIYIPANISEKEQEYIILHEKMHIKHGDHVVRIIMLVINIIYWWNPVIWAAMHFMKKDMEMFCDESVIKAIKVDKRGAYLRTLLNCSAKNSGIIPVMSFGETNTEKRIVHIVNLKKPKLYIYIILVIYMLVCVVGCGSVTKTDSNETTNNSTETSSMTENKESINEIQTDNNELGLVDDEKDNDVLTEEGTTIEYNGEVYEPENAVEPEKTVTVDETGYEQYDSVIEQIIEIRASGTDNMHELLEDKDISYIWMYEATYEHGGYYLIDLDGDGTEEMLLGQNGDGAWDGVIYDIYTIKDDKLIKLCTGGERDRYHLSTGNVITNEGSSGAANSIFAYYTCENGELVLGKCVEMDEDYITNEVYYAELDEEYNVIKYITVDEYNEIVNGYVEMPIEFTLFEDVCCR